ncbi:MULTISPECIES: MFS transporter [Chryseobacterium]|uniref:FHS family glucose/mannose:H+ symporter-like MFS transporter n=1 Tax=Chryseobacterium camelliae TaxID=1265445 RepID=A0ABU0TG04_9FLAO|nr:MULTISPECIES: MFS transporter [Chryseobacterium]MDT3406202.1 FHS family glucose/mannose:H+ symporter-like MFS transporter [Pseudacidovorax intermedius]MDQ1095996.1 FHS family glucose/mannose:H+ symporter-like MFS transporter [Chryseobacterium camelliae]MDQ1099933.1 FHS family glucose/mannose:H+ symporter-like MFS transporter [Chryseobacterium sp. SORGH_AS_1048]MDR6087278.1 FHS family glucose/mannose:H+ symporter-like MFS transporter [Chryseobacterium sp. SORGH_AS_0909]MDR6131652.1 FHS famil
MTTKTGNLSLPLKLSFLIFSMVLNCMGIVILQLSEAKITYEKLGFLESFKDLPIAFISLFAVGLISKTGTKKALLTALLTVGICSAVLPFVEVFWFYKLWFAIIGVCFAIGKICIFGIIRNNIADEKSLAKTMNNVEASFMIGIFVVNTGFGWLISSSYSEFWKLGFLSVSLLSFITVFLFSKLDISEPASDGKGLIEGISAMIKLPILLFFLVIFCIVFIEQSFNSWLPSYYKTHLKVNSFFALQATSFMALFSYSGRVVTARLIHRFSLVRYYWICLAFILILLCIISGIQYFYSVQSEILLYLFPVIGLFLSPLYPVINSKMIAGMEREKISLLTSCIVIFSSLGSSVSSIMMSILFGNRMLDWYSLYILATVIVLLTVSSLYFYAAKKNL